MAIKRHEERNRSIGNQARTIQRVKAITFTSVSIWAAKLAVAPVWGNENI